MSHSGRRALLMFTSALMAATIVGTDQAQAQYLFDRLFGGHRERRYERYERYEQPAPQPPKPPAAPKVSGPQYYTYKTDPLVRVDISAIRQASRSSGRADDDLTTNSVANSPSSASPRADAQLVSIVTTAPVEAEPAVAPFTGAMQELGDYELRAEKEIADAIVAHYSQRPDFIWVSGETLSHRGEAALAVLRAAGTHGLDEADYATPPLGGLTDAERHSAKARFELAMSARLLRYVRDAHRGRVDPNRISGYHDFAQKPLDYGHVLNVLSDTFAVATYLEGWHPQNAHYAALRTELAELRRSNENAIVVDPKTFVRPGGSTPELAKLLALIERNADEAMRTEFAALFETRRGAETYTDDLIPLIKAAQTSAGIKADGIVGPRTVAAIAGNSKADRMDKVVVAMEQLRWLPGELGNRHVFINVPAFEASYVEGGDAKLTMRTVVGKNATQTYFFQDQISYVEFHPYWGIPRSILVNTYLPKLYDDPSYLDRIGYEVTDRRGQRVSSSSVNWTAYGANIPFDVRQPPGPKNSLGEMKIMFPNKHAIYMHDTPEKHLFDRESRNFSNGCVRLQDPRAMAAAVLGWDRGRIDERLKGAHGQQNLDIKVPVYVAYFTAWPDASGKVAYYHDVYGRDGYMQKALEKIAEVRAPNA